MIRNCPILLVAAVLVAQQTPSGDNTPLFRTGTQLVLEMVSAKDKNGKAIEGLKAEDFRVTENGVPQAVAFVDYQNVDNVGSVAAVPTPTDKDALRTFRNSIAPELPGDTRYRNRRLLALYFDLTSMPPADQYRAIDAARRFFKEHLTPNDAVAILAFDGGSVHVFHDFTSDRNELQWGLNALISSQSEKADSTAGDDSDSDTGSAFGQDDAEFNVFNTDRQLAALQTAVNMMKGIRERKSLIYFSSGVQLSGITNQAQLRSTTNAALRANVALYPVDSRGLIARPPLGDATQGSPGGIGMYSATAAVAGVNNLQRSQDTLYSLAADSGGKALLDNNNLELGITNAQAASSGYYVLGYYTTNTALDGKYRRVNITLKEVSAKLEYRQGYFAGKQFAKFTAADKERQLEEALMLQQPLTDLTIAVEVNYFQLNRAEYYVPTALKIPGSELALARRRGADHTVIDFIGEIKDEYGVTIQNIRDKVDVKLTEQTAAELAGRPVEYDSGYTLLPGNYVLKVLARDEETGRIGTCIAKFRVPNLNPSTTKDNGRLAISSVVLSGQRIPVESALYTVGKDKALKLQSANPLVANGQKLLPSVTRVFSRARELFVFLQAYQQNQDAPSPLISYVSFFRDGRKVMDSQPVRFIPSGGNQLRTVDLRFEIAMGGLNPGRYDCEVSVLNARDGKSAFWRAPIYVTR